MIEDWSRNLAFEEGEISRENRHSLLGQSGGTIWFTGISGSGKSTVAVALEKALYSLGKLSYRLDGDNVRLGINKNLGFSEQDRRENIRRIGEVAVLIGDAGIISLSSFISPYSADRQQVRALHEKHGLSFIEVYVDCSLEEAERRDPKGLYKKARKGEIKNFTAIDHPYEAPTNPEIRLQTELLSVEEEIECVIAYLRKTGVITQA